MVWYGMVWNGMVRYGMGWDGTVRYGTVRYGMVLARALPGDTDGVPEATYPERGSAWPVSRVSPSESSSMYGFY